MIKHYYLRNSFKGSFWNSKITSANVSKKETVLGYFVGPIGALLTNSLIVRYFSVYLTDVLGMTVSKGAWIPAFLTLFPTFSKFLDAATNFIMGKIIDSTVCRQGKVRPWILLSAPFVSVSMILLFLNPFSDVKWQAVWILITFNLYYSFSYTMWSMSRELCAPLSTRNSKQRSKNAFYTGVVMNVGTGAIAMFFGIFVQFLDNDPQKWSMAMSLIACIIFPLFIVQYFYTRERVTEERRMQATESVTTAVEIKAEASTKEQLKACIKDKTWVWLLVFVLINQICLQIKLIGTTYYCGWAVMENAYGSRGFVETMFSILSYMPLGLGLLFYSPLLKKFGREKMIYLGGIITTTGAIIAYATNNLYVIIGGCAISSFGGFPLTYALMTFYGDVYDHVEWKTNVRCDGFSASAFSAINTVSYGIAFGIFQLGLSLSGYIGAVKTGESVIDIFGNTVDAYMAQPDSAISWIRFCYLGISVLTGVVTFIIFKYCFNIEKEIDIVHNELQERRKAEYAALGLVYIPDDEREKIEAETQEKEWEEKRVEELKAYCAKKGLNFESEEAKYQAKKNKKKK